MFLQILTNAIDFLSTSDRASDTIGTPTIHLLTEMKDDFTVRIRIIDNGPGISEEVCHRVFDPFFSTKPVGQGVGLGLSISYQIVAEQHKGSLYCASQPEQGAEFVIELPVTQHAVRD